MVESRNLARLAIKLHDSIKTVFEILNKRVVVKVAGPFWVNANKVLENDAN